MGLPHRRLDLTFNTDGTISYLSTTVLQVRGKTEPFNHVDRNTLTKVAEPGPNPLLQIGRGVAKAVAHGMG